jgi:hypothetical protein
MARGPLAGASGPGKFSKRTDLPSAYYGEGVETAAIKSGAPLANTPSATASSAPSVAKSPVTPMFAPTQRPDEPITAGIASGAGPGPEALMMNQPADYTNFNSNIQSYKPVLSYVASLENTSPETRRAIRQLMDSL